MEVDIVSARLDRAVEHFKAIAQAWEQHLKTRPHRLDLEVDPDGQGRIRFVRLNDPPLALSLILGEFLYELRAALDNCLYAVAIIDSGQNPPPKDGSLEWPICRDQRAWDTHRERRLSTLSPELIDDLYAIQPFQAEHPTWNSLRILNDLARTDRHRAVHFVTSMPATAKVRLNETLVRDFTIHRGPVTDDGVIATFTWAGDRDITPDDLDGHYEFDIDLAAVELGPGLDTDELMPPWGNLEKRLRSIHMAVGEYADGLLGHAVELRDARSS